MTAGAMRSLSAAGAGAAAYPAAAVDLVGWVEVLAAVQRGLEVDDRGGAQRSVGGKQGGRAEAPA